MLRLNIRSLYIYSVFLFALPCAAQDIELVFKDSSMINDTIIRLGDIATINDKSGRYKDQLKNLQIGDAAPAGYSRFINRNDLYLYVLQPSFKAINFTLVGKSRLCVVTDCIEKKVSSVQQELESFLGKELSWPTGSWKVTIRNSDESFKIVNKPYTIQFASLVNKFPKNQVNIQMNVRQGSRCYRTQVNCDISIQIPVVTAIVAIDRGQVITEAMCELKTDDVTHFGIIPYMKLSDVVGKKALRAISVGSPISKLYVMVVPDIEKGDAVKIEARCKTVSVAVSAIAREQGNVGDKIWVENSESHKLVRVKIQSKGIVTIL